MLSFHFIHFFIFAHLFIDYTAAELVIESERLRNFHGCDDLQQKQIYDGWVEAMAIAHTVKGHIAFDQYAATEFLGRSDKNERLQGDINGIFFRLELEHVENLLILPSHP